ncbi:MAG: winged helix-turn-helix domain-containing protein, partial [Pseudomonadota bacterium]
QRIRVAHRAGLRPQAPQPPTTINEPVSQLWSYRGDKYSDAGGVWDMNFDSDTNVIDVAIRRLRAKIDDSYEPKLIQTVRGMGYTLDIPDA